MNKEKFDYKFLGIKILIYGGILSLFLFQWFGPGLINAYKQRKENELIMYGGSVSDANKAIKKRNDQVEKLQKLIKQATVKYNNVLVYTNDTINPTETVLRANRKYRDDYRGTYAIGNNVIQENEEITNNIKDFITNKDSLGYHIFAKKIFNNQDVLLMQTNTIDSVYRYKVSYFYYYNDQQKKQLTNQINDKPNNHYSFYNESKKEQLDALNNIQFSKIIISEDELINNQIKQDVFIKLFAPRIHDNQNGVFYFSCYNKSIDSLTFSKKISFFKSMFLQRLKNKDMGQTKRFTVVNQ